MGADGIPDDSGEPQSARVYYDSGTFHVTLTVTDNLGATAMFQAQVEVKPLAVDVYFSPRRLNLKSKGRWITATIVLPRGYYAGMVDTDSLYLVPQGTARIPARSANRHHKKKYRRTRKLAVKFDRQALIEALDGVSGETSLSVMGAIATDIAGMGVASADVVKMEFSGTGIVKAYEKKKKGPSGHNFLHALMQFFSKGRSK